MKKVVSFIFAMAVTACFAQCPFAVTLQNKGSICLGSDTLVVSSANNLATINWYNGNTLVGSANAFVTTVSNAVTVAGGNGKGATANQFYSPNSICFDASGNLYVADLFNYRIQKFPPGSTSATNGQTVAGGNGKGNAANQFQPSSVFVDGNGNIFVANNANSRILKFPPNATSATNGMVVAGGNGQGAAPNQFSNPVSVFVDGGGNIFVVDALNDRIQKFLPGSTNGITVAGGNGYGSAPNQFNGPDFVFVDGSGNIYVDDAANNRIQLFTLGNTNGITVAGGNGFGSAPNQLSTPASIWVDGNGSLYVADVNNQRIQKFPAGSTSFTNGKTVAGGYGNGSAANQFSGPGAVCVDAIGNIYVADVGNNRIQKFSQPPLTITTIDSTFLPKTLGTYKAVVTDAAGCSVTTNAINISAPIQPSIGITGKEISVSPCSSQVLDTIQFTAVSTNGGSNPIYQWQVNGQNTGTNSTVFTAGLALNDIVTCTLISNGVCVNPASVTSQGYKVAFGRLPFATLTNKNSVCNDGDTLLVTSKSSIVQIDWYRNGVLDTVVVAHNATSAVLNAVTIAGGRGKGSGLDQLNNPRSVYLDRFGNMFVADGNNQRVQLYMPTSSIYGSTAAGGNGYINGGPANQLARPTAVCTDGSNNLYVADQDNTGRIKKFPQNSSSTSNYTVAAGGNGLGAASNQLGNDCGVFVDANGYLYVADGVNNRIQKFPPNSNSATNGITIAGGNGAGAAANQLNYPTAVFVDANGSVFVADFLNYRIQEFLPGSTNGITVAGGNGSGSELNQFNAYSLFVNSAREIYVLDFRNNRVLKFPVYSNSSTNGVVVAGGNGAGNAANQLNGPCSIYINASGNLFVCDANNDRIQKFLLDQAVISYIDTNYIPKSPSTYYAIVTDANGCTVITNTVTSGPIIKPSVGIVSNKVDVCAGSPIMFTATPLNASTPPFYQWLVKGNLVGNNNSPNYSSTVLANGDAVSCIISNAPGCATTDTSNSIIVVVNPLPTVGPANNITIFPGQSIVLSLPVTGNITTYTWSPPTNLSSNTVLNPAANPTQTTTYILKVATVGNCTASDSLTVTVSSPLSIPTGFTPNGDGRNDVFYVLGGLAGDKVKDFAVFDRWGKRLFQVQNVLPNDKSFGWDGKYNGELQAQGSYVYSVTISSANGTEKEYKGMVILVR